MQPVSLDMDTTRVRQNLIQFIQRQIKSAGFSKAVLGLSGGLDSCVVCCLAAEALGPDNVIAVRMPYAASAPSSLDHAQMVIDATGVQHLTIPVTPMVDPLFALYPDMTPLRKGNIMARQRMIVLFDQSAALPALVVGTGNKTEILLGYTTIFGDSACAFNPLGDLYKTQVRQLARILKIPDIIIEKAPSADLWAGQTDEADLGYTYADVDQLLYFLIEMDHSARECVEFGFAQSFVDSVIRRVQRMHYKRVLPPIAKVNAKTIGVEFKTLQDIGLSETV